MKITDVFSLRLIAGATEVRVTALDQCDQASDLLMVEGVQSYLRNRAVSEAIVNQELGGWALWRAELSQSTKELKLDFQGDELIVAETRDGRVYFYLVQVGPYARTLEFIMDSPEVQMGHWYLVNKL